LLKSINDNLDDNRTGVIIVTVTSRIRVAAGRMPMSAHPVKRSSRRKPAKPYPSFPLTPHNNGQWCKKIRGRIHFFGVWRNPQAALDDYLRVAADLRAGRQPSAVNLHPDAFTVKDACNQYLNHQFQKVKIGEIRPSTFEDCRQIGEAFSRVLGPETAVSNLTPMDFQRFRLHVSQHGLTRKSKGLGPHALSRAITVIKSIFRHAYDNELLEKPVRFGTGFDKPTTTLKRKVRRAAEMENGKRLFESADICSMIRVAAAPFRAMILLGINGGFGNTDCAQLPIKAIDFDQAIIEFDRPKTGIERVVPLWPETVEALRQALVHRPKPTNNDSDKLVFLTASGQPWVRESVHHSDDNGSIKKVVNLDAINHAFNKLLRHLNMKRKGVSFYALRHTFRTWADEVKDQHAIHRIMGHTIPGMSGIYIEEISLDRLRAVVNHVRSKLFGTAETSQPTAPTAASAT
jgi:integrase